MSDFVRVRSSEGSADEFLAPRSLVELEPDRYVIITDEPVPVKPKALPRRKSAPKPASK